MNLAAPHVTLGQPFQVPFSPLDADIPFTAGGAAFNFSPSFGTGSLTVSADLIDIGNLSLRQIGQASLIASNGAIRGDGTFDVAGTIHLEAAHIYPPTAVSFTISASDYQVGEKLVPGRVAITRSGTRELPLSAGGKLSIFGSIIEQGGVLVAPFGSITLGWDGTGPAPEDGITGNPVAVTHRVSLASGSVTSVAGVDAASSRELLVPYGINLNGVAWIDPAGTDITVGTGSNKAVTISGLRIADLGGSLIDIRGGGDLYSYRWVAGAGGSKDVLASSSSFAVIPGYQSDYAPYATFNDRPSGAKLGSDKGYANKSLFVGDQIQLGASDGLPSGIYTLLPARYALLPGAFLITPKSGAPLGTVSMPDGSSLVSGYRFNGLNDSRTLASMDSRFEVLPAAVVRARSEFEDYTANEYLKQGALTNHVNVPRLPIDAGHLILQATRSMTLQGAVFAQAAPGARGGLVDIASPSDILIGGPNTGARNGVLTLNAAQLSSFGAESLLIGGVRQLGTSGTTVTVKTRNVTVDNAGVPLMGSDIILVANEKLTLAKGAEVLESGQLAGSAERLLLTGEIALKTAGETFTVSNAGGSILFPAGTPGDDLIKSTVDGTITRPDGVKEALIANTPTALAAGSTLSLPTGGTISFDAGTGGAIPITLGDGVLLRVSSDPGAQIVRTGLSGSAAPAMAIGAGARISGAGIILDSTYATTLDPTASLTGDSISLNSGQVSLLFDNPGALQSTVGLVLAGPALKVLQGAKALSFLSYSSIDLYGTGGFSVGGSLAFHAAEIRGFNTGGGTISFSAQSVAFDNSPEGPLAAAIDGADGTLEFNANTIRIGVGDVSIERFANLNLNASQMLLLQNDGGLATQGALTVTTPLVAGERIAEQEIVAGGALIVQAPAGGAAAVAAGGLGASLTLEGRSITVTSDIVLPSGSVTLHASGGDVTVGGMLDVGGTSQDFYDLTRYTSGGNIRLTTDTGSIAVSEGGTLNVAAKPDGGNAGSITMNSPQGSITIGGNCSDREALAGPRELFLSMSKRFRSSVRSVPFLTRATSRNPSPSAFAPAMCSSMARQRPTLSISPRIKVGSPSQRQLMAPAHGAAPFNCVHLEA